MLNLSVLKDRFEKVPYLLGAQFVGLHLGYLEFGAELAWTPFISKLGFSYLVILKKVQLLGTFVLLMLPILFLFI